MATKKRRYKKIDYYLDLPWNYSVSTEYENGKKVYVVCVNELPGICSDGDTFEEAMAGAFKMYMHHNEEIPEPIDESRYKGNIAYRTTSQRHFRIAKEAQRRGHSLSQTLDECIDKALGKNSLSSGPKLYFSLLNPPPCLLLFVLEIGH